LRSLPRDVTYDAAVLEGCFGRAFGTLKAGAAGRAALDPGRMQQLAGGWFSATEGTWLDFQEFERWAMQEYANESGSGKQKK
jgi:hypothetical protein